MFVVPPLGGITTQKSRLKAELRTPKSLTALPRTQALDALKAIGPEATLALLTLLKNGSEKERRGAAKSLGYNQPDDKRVVPGLIESLEDESSEVRIQAVTALGEFGPKAHAATAALTKLLKENDEIIQAAAAMSLKKINPQAASKAGGR